MTKEETYDTHVYVEGRQRPLPVGMYTDEHSEICSIRFSNSFTLNVITPQDLLMLAQELETFAKRAYELHYDEEPTVVKAPVGVEWAINEARAKYLREEAEETARLWDAAAAEAEDTLGFTCGEEVDSTVGAHWKRKDAEAHAAVFDVEAEYDEYYSNLIDQNLKKTEATPEPPTEPSKVELLMQGTVSAPQIDPMNDPMNW